MDLLQTALRVLRSQPYGLFATAGTGEALSSTAPRVRLVEHLAVRDDGEVLFGTSPRSRKVSDVVANPSATYAVEDRARYAYAAVSGEAMVVADRGLTTELWREHLRPFFPAGPTGGDFVLIRLVPEHIETMDFSVAVHPEPFGLVPAVVPVRRRHG